MTEIMDINAVNEAAAELRKSGRRVVTNCYSFPRSFYTQDIPAVRTESSLLMLHKDHMTDRLLFFTTDADDLLGNAYRQLGAESCHLELVTRDRDQLRDELTRAGFAQKAVMLRLSCRDVSVHAADDGQEGLSWQFADRDDAAAIYELLHRIFDTGISHLPDLAETADAIDRREFTLHRNEKGDVTSLLQAVISPKSFYINQIYNSDDRRIIHSMLRGRLREYCGAGGRYAYAWTSEDNTASLKFHAKYGMLPDGLYDIVYHTVSPSTK